MLSARCEIIDLMTVHCPLDFVFKIAPRERGEFQIIFEYLFESLVAEHGFLRERHVGDCGRFLFSHCTTNHVNDRAGVDETAIALLEMV